MVGRRRLYGGISRSNQEQLTILKPPADSEGMGLIVALALIVIVGFALFIAATAWSIVAGSHGPIHRQTRVDREFHKIVRQLQ